MNFHRLRFNNNNRMIQSSEPPKPQFIPFGFKRFPPPPATIAKDMIAQVTPIYPAPEDKKMKWGEPTWFFFHTIAEKVKHERFSSLKNDIIEHIKIICNNLPCPICSEHATQYMKTISRESIRTKNDLQLMLFQFHNVVNKKKGYTEFTYEQLKEKYPKANLVNIIYHFMGVFGEKTNNPTLIASQMYKTRFIQLLKNWFNEHINDFDL